MRFPQLLMPPVFQFLRLLAFSGLLIFAGRVPVRAGVWIRGTTMEGLITEKESRGFSALPAPFGGFPALTEFKPSTAAGYAGLLKAMTGRRPADFFGDAVNRPAGGGAALAGPSHSGWPEGLNRAVEPLFHGRPEEARLALEILNAGQPDNYFILSSLAVAEEFCGRDRQALEKVETALRLNPNAQSGGAEWMHAAVLRAKNALAADPAWLEQHTISGIPRDHLPAGFVIQDGPRTLSLEEVHEGLMAHAAVRMLLVKPTDRVTAALLKELARVQARWWMAEGGLAVLDVADEYGARDTAPLRSAWTSAITDPYRPPPRWLIRLRRPKVMLGLAVAAAGFLALLFWQLRRRHQRRRMRKGIANAGAASQARAHDQG